MPRYERHDRAQAPNPRRRHRISRREFLWPWRSPARRAASTMVPAVLVLPAAVPAACWGDGEGEAFEYLGRRYGMRVAAIQGISTATEAITADVRRVARLIAERPT